MAPRKATAAAVPAEMKKEKKTAKKKANIAEEPRQTIYKNVSGSTIDPTKILFASYERKMQPKKESLEKQAADNLKKALEPGRRVIFKGIVDGKSVKKDPNGKKIYFLHVNSDCNVPGFKGRIIRIKVDDFVAPLCTKDKPTNEFNPKTATEYEIQAYISSRQGSEIEFCVVDMDMSEPETGFVIGSRLPALEKRRATFWYGQTTMKGKSDKVFVIDEGSIVEAQIVSVTYGGVFFEAQGLEGFIPLRELSHREIDNAKGYFKTSSFINIKIFDMERTASGKLSFRASHKATFPNPAPKYMAQYMPGDEIYGVEIKRAYYNEKTRVSVYYADVEDKFWIRCTMAKDRDKDPIRGDRVNVIVKGKEVNLDENTGQIWGEILHVYSEHK